MDLRKDRVLKIQKQLGENEILVITNPADIFYLVGINLDVPFVISKNSFYMLIPSMLEGQLKKIFRNNSLIVAESNKERLEMLKKKMKVEKVVLDNENTSVKFYNLLKQSFKNIRIKNVVSQLRQIKDKTEILNIKTACKILKKILDETKSMFKEGVREIEVKNFILKKFLEYNVEPSFEPIVAFDENTSYPHHVSENKKFKKNSLVLIDLGCKYKGYCCDVTRMYNVEKNPKIYYFYNLLKELQKKLISLCKPGVKVKDIDLYARKFVEQLGLKDKYLHSTGHGIGIEIHEPPRLSQFDETVLKENMVITIEPGIYFENEFGLRIEDDVLVRKKDSFVLTTIVR